MRQSRGLRSGPDQSCHYPGRWGCAVRRRVSWGLTWHADPRDEWNLVGADTSRGLEVYVNQNWDDCSGHLQEMHWNLSLWRYWKQRLSSLMNFKIQTGPHVTRITLSNTILQRETAANEDEGLKDIKWPLMAKAQCQRFAQSITGLSHWGLLFFHISFCFFFARQKYRRHWAGLTFFTF